MAAINSLKRGKEASKKIEKRERGIFHTYHVMAHSSILLFLLIITNASFLASAQGDNDVVLGDAGSNTCSSGYEKITSSVWSCRAAMSLGDLTIDGDQDGDAFDGVEDDDEWPSGCYYMPKKDESYFNTDSSGTGRNSARLYCVKPGVITEGPFTDDDNKAVFMGDSDVDYWRDTHTNVINDSYNFGVGGYTCLNVKKEIDDMFTTMNGVKTVVLVCGENDLTNKGVQATFRRFKQVNSIARNNGARVIMMGTKPEPSTKYLHTKYRKYDNKIRNYAKKLASKDPNSPPPLIFVDVYKSFEDLGNPSSLYDSDRLHLSARGYSYWSQWAKQAHEYDGSASDYCVIWRNGECSVYLSKTAKTV